MGSMTGSAYLRDNYSAKLETAQHGLLIMDVVSKDESWSQIHVCIPRKKAWLLVKICKGKDEFEKGMTESWKDAYEDEQVWE